MHDSRFQASFALKILVCGFSQLLTLWLLQRVRDREREKEREGKRKTFKNTFPQLKRKS